MTAWIKMIPEDEATGVLRELYDEATLKRESVPTLPNGTSIIRVS